MVCYKDFYKTLFGMVLLDHNACVVSYLFIGDNINIITSAEKEDTCLENNICKQSRTQSIVVVVI